jgi:hypothetical protein
MGAAIPREASPATVLMNDPHLASSLRVGFPPTANFIGRRLNEASLFTFVISAQRIGSTDFKALVVLSLGARCFACAATLTRDFRMAFPALTLVLMRIESATTFLAGALLLADVTSLT